MKKITLMLAFLAFIGLQAVLAQTTVTGTVTDKSGAPVPGATVIPEGNPQFGSLTEADGTYKLDVPAGVESLIFSFIGMETQRVAINGQSSVNVVMLSTDVMTDEVVITALGVSREKKSLGYAVQEIGGEEVNAVKETNFVSSLSGKVAGVNIKSPNTMGGSANVVIRGSNSLLGNNQALFVIDGVPVDNSNTSSNTGGWGGYDYGNAAMDINPDDIASISVLKGAAASALYGSRASNGVILVTTKSGKKQKGLGVTFTSGIQISQADKASMPKHQKEYGAGYGPYYEDPTGYFYYGDVDGDGSDDLIVPVSEDASWGAKYDPNLMVLHWYALDPNSPQFGIKTPWVAGANDFTTFFETGVKYDNNISFDAGNEKGSFRFSYSNVDEQGLLPNSSIKRNSFSLKADYKLNDKLTVEGNGTFTTSKALGRFGTGYDAKNPMQSFGQWFQTNVNFEDLKEYESPEGLHRTWNYSYFTPDELYPIYFDNPYWVRYKNYQNDERNRFFGYTKLAYEITSDLTAHARFSTDFYAEGQEERIAPGSVDLSSYTNYRRTFNEFNADFYVHYKKMVNDISINAIAGSGMRRNDTYSIFASTMGGLIIPDFYNVSNSVATRYPTERATKSGINSLYANLSFGFKDLVYVDVTGRQDVSSTLPEGNNKYFYPSVSTSFILSEIDAIKGINGLSFAKLRLNWAQVGSDAPAYSTSDNFSQQLNWGGLGLFSMPTTLNNANLKPEIAKSIEAGLEARFIDERLALDFSVYKTNTFDQIMPIDISGASGYSYMYINAGEVENKGIEIALSGTPVKTNDFSWNVNVNWFANRNMVVDLGDDIDNILLFSAWDVSVNATEGEPYGAIKGTNYVFHENGGHIVDADGMPLMSEKEEVIGNINPDWNMGVSNTINYKNLAFSFLIDIQKGGDVYSVSTKYGRATGVYEETAGLNDKGNPKRDPVSEGGGILFPNTVNADGTPNTTYASQTGWGEATYYTILPTAEYIFDASYVKLREATLSYKLPSNLVSKTPLKGISIAAVGRNLWIIHKNTYHFDPEATLGSGNLQGIESGSYPTARTFGFNLKLEF